MRKYILPALAGLTLLVCGCFQTKETYTLNPDGSGKVLLEATFQPMNMMGGEEQDPEEQLRKSVKDIIVKSDGIEIWKDVSYKRTDDGKIYVTGTAYFKDLSRVKFKGLGETRVEFKKQEDGTLVLTVDPQQSRDGGKKPAADKEAPKLTDEQIAQKVKLERTNFQQAKGFMSGFLSTMTTEKVFLLPGSVTETNNLKKDEKGGLHFLLEGKKMLEVMDTLMADDEFVKKQVIAGKNVAKEGPDFDDRVNEMVFGSKGPVRAVVAAGAKPLFDLAAEVKAADAGYKELLTGLGAVAPVKVEAAPAGGGLKSVTVAGVRMVRVDDQERGLRAFNWSKGYTFSIVGEFSGSVIKAENGTLEKAVADNGNDLLPEKEWDRRIKWLNLSKDKTAVIFDVDLKLPGEGVNGFKEISGSFEYTIAEGFDEVDAGLSEFKKGAKGSQLGISVKELKNGWEKGTQVIKLGFGIGQHMVKSVVFYDANGKKLEVTQGSPFGSGDKFQCDYTLVGEFPEKGRIVVEVRKNLRKFKVPFTLENISLLGAPLKK